MQLLFKYIIVRTGAILFNEYTTHSQVAEGFNEVYSAGFCHIDIVGTKPIECFGESESLGIKSIPALDTFVITDLFSKLSQIKYYAFDVDEFYSHENMLKKQDNTK